jgi:opacity protein-like surface antigen
VKRQPTAKWIIRLCGWMAIFAGTSFCQQRFDVTPLFGYGSELSFPLTVSDTETSGKARIPASGSWAIAAGGRWGEGEVVEFRYMRQSSTMQFEGPLGTGVSFNRPAIVERYMGDFTHEFVVESTGRLRPFLSAGVGVARIASDAQSYYRAAFAIGGGLKWFPLRNVGIRVHAEYLPIWASPEIKGFVCGNGCAVSFGGRIASQGQVSIGPILTF